MHGETRMSAYPDDPSIASSLLAKMADGSLTRTVMTNKRAVATVQLENEHVRVTEWRFAPGDATGHHRHAHDYVVVPVVDGELELIESGSRSRSRLQRGKPYFRNAGVEHDVINAGGANMIFVEIELKDTAERR